MTTKIRVIRKSRLAKIFKVEGIVIYPFIFFLSARPEIKLINHELIHILQVRRDGFFTFYFNYLKEYCFNRMKKLKSKTFNKYSNYQNVNFL